MNSLQQTSRHLIVESGSWRRWVVAFVLIGLSIVATFLIVTSFFPGETFILRLGAAYRVLWENTTQRQYTFIMRDNPWLLIIPGATVIFTSGLLLPMTRWGRAGYVYIAFGIGFLAGHVFW